MYIAIGEGNRMKDIFPKETIDSPSYIGKTNGSQSRVFDFAVGEDAWQKRRAQILASGEDQAE